MEKKKKKLATKYYPKLWGINRLVALVKAGKLSEEDYNEITGFVYPATSDAEATE